MRGVGQVRLCMCVSYEERRVVVGLPDSECVVLGRSVCVCVCVIRGTPSSCRSAGESVRGVGQVRLFVRVSYEEYRVAVGLLERLSVWCSAGPSVRVCVIRGMPIICRSARQ